MKIVYIAGPYRHNDPLGVEFHIGCARSVAAMLARHGIGFYCPHLNSARFEWLAPNTPDSFYLDMGLEFLSKCDAILVMPDWNRSEGTKAEIEWWRENREEQTIFYMPKEMKIEQSFIDWYRRDD